MARPRDIKAFSDLDPAAFPIHVDDIPFPTGPSPTIGQWYTIDEAIAAFGSTVEPIFLCDKQFIVLPNAIACMITIGESANEPELASSMHVRWRPRRTDYDTDDDFPWLPLIIREVYRPDRKQKLREHHIFLKRLGDHRYFYCGKAHLGSWGTGGAFRAVSADFFLDQQLPRETWLALGGFVGWLVEANHVTRHVDTNDIETFTAITEELLGLTFSHLHLTRYENDYFSLFTNAKRGWLTYKKPESTSVCLREKGRHDVEEEFHCSCGIYLGRPQYETVLREKAVEATKEYFTTRELPKCVKWNTH